MSKLVYFVLLTVLISCGEKPLEKTTVRGQAFGTTFSIQAYINQNLDLEKGIDSILNLVNKSVSTYLPDSDISKINRGDTSVIVDQIFIDNFILSSEVYQKTDGYFDPTIGVLRNAYGFGDIKPLKVIDNNQLTAGEYIWITDKTPNDWTVFQIVDSQFVVREMFVNTELDEFDRTTATLTVRQNSLYSIVAGDLVAITGAQLYSVYGYFEVITIDYETIVIAIPETNEFLDFTDEEYSLSVLRTVRVEDFDQYNNIAQNSIFDNQRVWIDNYENNSWAVLDNKPVYNSVTQEYNPNDLQDSSNLADIDQEFTKSISVTADNKMYASNPNFAP